MEAGDLRVRFFWQSDRYAHEISRRAMNVWHPAWMSVEGSPADDWPPSPPFQSLHIQQRDDGRTLALLVGMAGKSHWSASIEIEAESPSVLFDVACRVRDCEAGPLGSTYRAAKGAIGGDVGLAIELSRRFGPATLQHAAGQTRVVAQSSAVAAPQTVRWDYRLCLDE